MAKPKAEKDTNVEVLTINKGVFTACVLGTTPMILNRMSEKARHQLLYPSQKANAAERASRLKHDPMEEFRASPYVDGDDDGVTYLQQLSACFKKAIMSVAVDLPGSSKAQIGRLTWVEGERVSLYGVPQMLMSIVRSADMNKTPDVRTRAIVPQWACKVTVSYIMPLLKEQAVVNLLAAAGQMNGIGDWRIQKGAGTYGSYELVDETDVRFKAIVKNGGRATQLKAMKAPEFYDDETRELYTWFDTEIGRRGAKKLRAV